MSRRIRRAALHDVALAIRGWQIAWRSAPPTERAAAAREAHEALVSCFLAFDRCGRQPFAKAMQRAGSTGSELRELLTLYSTWLSGDFNDPGVLILHPEGQRVH